MKRKFLQALQNKIDAVRNRYNADYDSIPNAQIVTWSDEQLLSIIDLLLLHVDDLEDRIEELERITK